VRMISAIRRAVSVPVPGAATGHRTSRTASGIAQLPDTSRTRAPNSVRQKPVAAAGQHPQRGTVRQRGVVKQRARQKEEMGYGRPQGSHWFVVRPPPWGAWVKGQPSHRSCA
jgi:hypothetical protein